MDLVNAADWLAKPYYELAFGFFYFAVVCLFKFLVTSKNTGPDNKVYRRDDLDPESGIIHESAAQKRFVHSKPLVKMTFGSNSNAPMSGAGPIMRGAPRWS